MGEWSLKKNLVKEGEVGYSLGKGRVCKEKSMEIRVNIEQQSKYVNRP